MPWQVSLTTWPSSFLFLLLPWLSFLGKNTGLSHPTTPSTSPVPCLSCTPSPLSGPFQLGCSPLGPSQGSGLNL